MSNLYLKVYLSIIFAFKKLKNIIFIYILHIINLISQTEMSIPKIICVRNPSLKKLGYANLEQWVKNPDNLYIGRKNMFVKGADESKWKNPFPVDKSGGRDECLRLYREYILSRKDLLNSLSELEGKTLGCWCKPEACHGDILIELFKKYKK